MSSNTLLKSLALAVIALSSACRSGALGSGESARSGEPLALERLMVGSVYGVGSHFASDGLEFRVEGFGADSGNAEIGSLEPAPTRGRPAKQPAKSVGKTLRLSHATLRVRGGSAERLEFDFADNGGPVAIEIGGERRSVDDFIALDGSTIGTARIAVREENTAGVRRGHVSVEGKIENLALAGASLDLATLRFTHQRVR